MTTAPRVPHNSVAAEEIRRLREECATLRADCEDLRFRLDNLDGVRSDDDLARASNPTRQPSEAETADDPIPPADRIVRSRARPDTDPARSRAISRRGLMSTLAVAALGVVAVDSLGRTTSAQAANGDPITAGGTTAASQPTALTVSDTTEQADIYGFGVIDHTLNQFPEKATLAGHTNGTYDAAVLGYDEGRAIGVHGMSAQSVGVQGEGPTGVKGTSGAAGSGILIVGGSAVLGIAGKRASGVAGVTEPNSVSGSALIGASLSTKIKDPAVLADSLGFGPGVAPSSAKGPGVSAVSKQGRGVVAQGPRAQLQLVPGKTASHPKDGQRGDFYVDSSGRLWYCRQGGGRATWVRLA